MYGIVKYLTNISNAKLIFFPFFLWLILFQVVSWTLTFTYPETLFCQELRHRDGLMLPKSIRDCLDDWKCLHQRILEDPQPLKLNRLQGIWWRGIFPPIEENAKMSIEESGKQNQECLLLRKALSQRKMKGMPPCSILGREQFINHRKGRAEGPGKDTPCGKSELPPSPTAGC